MYDYISLRIDATPCNETITDLLAALLADEGFESFVPDTDGIFAYVRNDFYSEENVRKILKDFPISGIMFNHKEELIKGEDWNKEWEQNYFQPISIDGRVVVRSSFHKDVPEAPIEIIIDPKMAFGTGHHSTTSGMISLLLDSNLEEKSVIDMGTGTGILAILAKKLGAEDVVGIDIDEFALENARENGELNKVSVEWIVGDDKVLSKLNEADYFLANINLNVITDNLEKYVSKLKRGGYIFLSGFLDTDREKIIAEATKLDLVLQRETIDKNWLAMVFCKEI